MPRYIYRVRDKYGKVLEGTLEAQDGKELRKKLDARGYFVIEYSEKRSAEFLPADLFSFKKKVTYTDISIFSWQLYTMVNAGLPLLSALKIIINQITNERMKEVLIEIHKKVEEGSAFSETLKEHPRIFSRLYVQMVHAGEVGGVLDNLLLKLALFYENQAEVKERIRSAMIYPMVLGVICVGVIVFMITFVLPRFAVVFEDIGAEVPPVTQVLMGLGGLLRSYWYVFFIAFGILGVFVSNFIKTEAGRYSFDKLMLNLPGIGNLVRKTTASQFTQILAVMVAAGIPILTTLEVVTDTLENKVIIKALHDVTARVGEGKSIAQPLAESGVFPDMVVNMIHVGEETGSLEEILTKVSDFYNREVDSAIKAFTKVIEPVMIVFMTIVIGFISVSIFLPLTDIMEGVHY
jgi:type IV pilus assembly protein PilC